MSETTYVIDLTPDGLNRYRHHHILKKKQIVYFRVQYEAYLDCVWRAIVRYDAAHGFAHRDIIHPDGSETKISFQQWDYAQVLTYGERDLKQHWATYRQAYARELAQLKKPKRGRR